MRSVRSLATTSDKISLPNFHLALRYGGVRLKNDISMTQLRRGVQSYVNFYNGRRLSSVLEYLTPDSVYEGRCVSTKPLKNHYFFGNRLDIRSMPAIVSINIYSYPQKQSSPKGTGQRTHTSISKKRGIQFF